MRALICLLALAGICHGAGVVRTLDGDVVEGNVSLSPYGVVVTSTAGEPPRTIDFNKVLRADFIDAAAGRRPALGPGVQLLDGAVIGGRITAIDGTTVRLNGSASGKDVSIALPNVARLLFAALPGDAEIVPGQTGAMLPNGDFFEGSFKTLEGAKFKVSSPIFGLRTFEAGDASAAVLRDVFPNRALAYEFVLADGSVFPAALVQVGADGVTVHETAVGGEMKFPLGAVTQIRCGPGRYVLLSTLKPAHSEIAGQAKGQTPRVAVDETLEAGPLALNGRSLEHGITVAPGTSLTYPLEGGFSLFACQVGVPVGEAEGLKVSFLVLVDGRLVYRSPAIGTTDKAQQVRVNVTGARTLAIYVDPPLPANSGMSGVWGDALLVRH